MVLWFAVLATVLVAEIFRSPMVDYRMVALGALLPLIEVVIGRVFFLHTLLAPVLVLTLVMATTSGRRLRRRRLLGIPIGMFFHLILDATWADTALFWWPVAGLDLSDRVVPERGQSPLLTLLLELVAVGVGVWAYRRYGLDDPDNRRRLLTTGHLDRSVLRPG
ncbi:MAG: hypothetical protein AAGD35_20565 [Actinomycetota bacterium]